MKVNINTAIVELCQLPGVSEELALKIVDYREKNGPFRDPSDLTRIDPRLQDVLDQARGDMIVSPVCRVDINTAVDELSDLPNVGAALAFKIVKYRMQHGPFERPEDLRRVDSRLDRLYGQLEHMIEVRQTSWWRSISLRGYISIFSDLGQGIGGIFAGLALVVSVLVGIRTAQALQLEMAATQVQLAQAGIAQPGLTPAAMLTFPNIPSEDMVVILNSAEDFSMPNFAFEITNYGQVALDEAKIELAVLSPPELGQPTSIVALEDMTLNPDDVLVGDMTREVLNVLAALYEPGSEAIGVTSVILKARFAVSAVQQDYYMEDGSRTIIEVRVDREALAKALSNIDQYENQPARIKHQ